MPEKLYSIRQLAKENGMEDNTIYNLVHKGVLSHFQFPNRVIRIRESDWEKLLRTSYRPSTIGGRKEEANTNA